MAQKTPGGVIAAVMGTIQQRKRTMPENSYVATLLRRGADAIGCKVAEETGEVIKAVREENEKQQVREFCDLFFHAMVLMASKDISLAMLEDELDRRHGISGITEKKSRKKKK